ncbi:DUF1493 family protein [Cellvibrio polysaccharolyticus]|uniref:DUF1493 family protein n=1 Tax=Cellvibrio polysaccharolyticus TaxID=2082724 RepID=A0A928V2W1_9GAMM|nr:DUF1493 family protein [Cellvibrio polysaccharolyticus]MBE8715941.1 DUF1493 family protein [Cellvibrio polysaccharolyticus]
MEITKEVYEVISHHTLEKPEALSNELYIEQNLKLSGDDVAELLEEMQSKFEIDFSTFNFSLHFSPEVGWSENPEFGYYPVTISHLVQVATSKVWFLPEKNEANFQKEKKHTLLLKGAIVAIIVILGLGLLLIQ